MTDRLSKARRSWNMSRIRSKDTKPELAVRSIVHSLGYRYGLHSRHLPGKPDMVLTRLASVIFVHGCFWHRHPGCKFSYSPKTRRRFWKQKFTTNVERDRLRIAVLKSLGWHVTVVWECEVRQLSRLRSRLQRILGGRNSRAVGSTKRRV